ncbi:MAG: FHA domain-containing protein [Muribaculum sp.]|nr:FHA domain-containing protein [Muribaculaceae bacterium]MCM1081082.1 FHA domain-containing protein [Muribaculum sp.]
MMKCPYCNSEIDNRSLYCDQCGTKLQANNVASNSAEETIWEIDDLLSDEYSYPKENLPQAPTRLVCSKYGMEIRLRDNAVIGRTTGDYVGVFGKCNYISSTHAILKRTSKGWSITDMGSTNGTTVNGVKCRPTLNFGMGDKVCLAVYYEFVAK